MDHIPSNPITQKNTSQWTNDAAGVINAAKTVQSQDFRITKTSHGTKIALKGRHKFIYEAQYRGEYDANAHYGVNDIVRVLPDEVYPDINGDEVGAMEGIWICVSNIPDAYVSNAIDANDPDAGNLKRIDGVEYFPQWPEPDGVADSDNPDGRYWELIGLIPIEMSLCLNGIEKTYYIGAMEKPDDSGE